MTLLRIFEPWGHWYHERARFTMGALAAGAARLGYVVRRTSQRDGYVPCDVALMWGAGKRRFPETLVRDEIVRAHGDRPFVRVERGYVHREEYYSIGLGQLWGRGAYRNDDVGPDRFARLAVELAPCRELRDGYVLIMGQVPWDTQCQHVDLDAWRQGQEQFAARWYPQNPVRYRPHPQVLETRPLAEDLAEARIVLTLNSTSGVDAVLAGAEARASDPGSMIYPAGPEPQHRERWAWRLAYCQWTVDEMRRGHPFRHLLPELP